MTSRRLQCFVNYSNNHDLLGLHDVVAKFYPFHSHGLPKPLMRKTYMRMRHGTDRFLDNLKNGQSLPALV